MFEQSVLVEIVVAPERARVHFNVIYAITEPREPVIR